MVTVDWGRNDADGADDYIEMDDLVDGVDLPVAIVSQAAVNRLIGWPADIFYVPGCPEWALVMDRLDLQLAWIRVVVDSVSDRITISHDTLEIRLPVPRYDLADGEGGGDMRMVPFAITHTPTTECLSRYLVRLAEDI